MLKGLGPGVRGFGIPVYRIQDAGCVVLGYYLHMIICKILIASCYYYHWFIIVITSVSGIPIVAYHYPCY